jgi:hypothetical protein
MAERWGGFRVHPRETDGEEKKGDAKAPVVPLEGSPSSPRAALGSGRPYRPPESPKMADLLRLGEAIEHTPASPHTDHKQREGKRKVRVVNSRRVASSPADASASDSLDDDKTSPGSVDRKKKKEKTNMYYGASEALELVEETSALERSDLVAAREDFTGDIAVKWSGKLTGQTAEVDEDRCYVFVHRQKSLFGNNPMRISFDQSESAPIALTPGQSLVFSTARHGHSTRRGLQLHIIPPSGRNEHGIDVYIDFHKTPHAYIRLVSNGGWTSHGGVRARVLKLAKVTGADPDKTFVHIPTHAEFHHIIAQQDDGDLVQTPHDSSKGKTATIVAFTSIALLALILLI